MKHRSALVVVLAAAAFASAEAEPAKPKAASGRQHTVEIRDFQFVPAKLRVKAGDVVVFVNRDTVSHTAIATDKSWDSGAIAANTSWRLKVTKTTAVAYLCQYHPVMRAALSIQVGQ